MEKVFAQSLHIGDQTIQGPTGFAFTEGTIGPIITQALTYVFAFGGIGLLLMIISSGFAMMLSAGDAKKLEQAKGRLTNAIIGFLLIFAAFWIVQIAGTVFGWTTSIQSIFGQ